MNWCGVVFSEKMARLGACTLIIYTALFMICPPEAVAQFRHPGIFSTREELDFVKARIEEGKEPWKSAFAKLKSTNPTSRVPKPHVHVPGSPDPKERKDMDEMTRDGSYAYASALLWYFTREKKYADHAIRVLNAWSIFQRTGMPLYLTWAAPHFLNAAEIMKHTPGSGWKQSDIDKFSTMVDKHMWPRVQDPGVNYGSNHAATANESQFAIAIFLDDQAKFNKAIENYKWLLPRYIFMNTANRLNGQCNETCRDLNHTKLGTLGLMYAAQAAWNQGVDLWGPNAARYQAFAELHAGIMTGRTRVPSNLCNGKVHCRGNVAWSSPSGAPPCNETAWEILFNQINGRLGRKLPHTEHMLKRNRPLGEISRRNVKWETLLHANLSYSGDVTSPPPQTYTLTINVAGQGTVAKAPDKAKYNAGQVVTLTATAAKDVVFNGWSGAATGTTNPINVTMSANRTVNAFFTQPMPSEAEKLTIVAAQASAEQNDDHLKEFSYDGDPETRWANDNTADNNWIIFDLGESGVVNALKLKLNMGETRTYPLKIEVGESINSFTETWSGDLPPNSGLHTIVLTEATGRYVRVSMTGPNSDGSLWFSIFQAEVWGQSQGTSILSVANSSMQQVRFNQIQGGFTVTAPGASAKLEVFDLKGKLLFQKSGLFENRFIPVRQNGIYFLRFSQGDRQVNQRLLIQN